MKKARFRGAVVSLLFCGGVLWLGVRLNQVPVPPPIWKIKHNSTVKAMSFSRDGSILTEQGRTIR